MYSTRKKLCALLTLGLVPLRGMSLWLIAAAMFVNAADKPAEPEGKTLLEKYAAAYSAMDAKALEPLVSKPMLEQCKEQFHQYRKNHQKPELTVVYSGEKAEKDTVVLTAAATLKINGKDVYASQQTVYTLKDKCIAQIQQQQDAIKQTKAAPSKQQINSFWDAVRLADAIGIVTVENKAVEAGKEKSEAAVTSSVKTLLSGEVVTGEAVKLPKWAIFQLKPGRHLLPLTKVDNNFEAFGMGYEVPAITQDSDKAFADMFLQYKQLAPEKENEFLKSLLLDAKFKSLNYAALRKIAMSGEFKRKLNALELMFWQKVCQAQGDDIMFKSALISALGNKSFDPDAPVFLEALEDKQLSGIVGGLYMRHDKTAFTAKMLQYLDDPAKREIALKNSFVLVNNPEYVVKAMKYFDQNDKKLFPAFIPVLTAKDNKAGKEAIAKFLKESDPKQDFNNRMMLFAMIWRNNDPAYIAETKALLTAADEMLLKSPAYPTALGYLYRNNDLDGMKMLLKYLDSVKPGTREEMMVRNLMFSLRIKPEAMRQPIGPTASRQPGAMNLRNQPLSGSNSPAVSSVDTLRRDLEAKIKGTEYIQQNPKDNIKSN